MKKVKTKLSIIVVLVFVFTMVIGATAFGAWTSVQKVDAYSGVKVYFNGQEVINPDQPLIINDRTYVPLRMIMELVGSGVTWDAANYRVMLTGAGSKELAAKDKEIAELKSKIAELEKNTSKGKGGDLDEIEEELIDLFEDAGDEYFDDNKIKVALTLTGDEDDIAYSIKLDFKSSRSYDDLSDVSKKDIESFLDDVEEELTDAIDGTDYEDADITGKLTDKNNSKLYVKYNGKSYSYNLGTDDLGDIEDEVKAAFRSAGSRYFGDSLISVSISLDGDEDDISYRIDINASRSDIEPDQDDIDWLEDDVIDAIKAEIRGTDFSGADIKGRVYLK